MVSEFREVPGWPGYRVSRDGVVQTGKNNGGILSGEWKVKEAFIDRDGYLKVNLSHKKRHLSVGVHVLVLTCFGGPRPPGNVMVLHGNGNCRDNRIENLRWGFADENAEDRDSHGTTARHERNGNAKLTWVQVYEIRALHESGKSAGSIAKLFAVSKKAVLNIIHKRTWDDSRALPTVQSSN